MKKLLSLLWAIPLVLTLSGAKAQSSSLDCTPNGLQNLIAAPDRATLDSLVLTGSIDARDFKFIRDSLPALQFLDLSGVEITAYQGKEGTSPNVTTDTVYSANAIPQFAFYKSITTLYDTILTTVILSKQLDNIGNYAFRNCSALKNINFPVALTGIGSYAFNGCSGLSGELKLPVGLSVINNYTFHGCNGFNKLTLPAGITSIGDYAFRGCTGFRGELILPVGMTSVGSNAFYGCNGFTGDLKIPVGIKTIWNYAFAYCSGMTDSLILPEGLTNIQDYAFSGCGFTGELNIPSTVTSIGTYAFGNTGFTGRLTLPVGLTFIGNYTFYNCSKFSGELIIPEKVTEIGNYAFAGCSLLDSVKLNNSVNAIGNNAFENCTALKGKIIIPAGVQYIFQNTFRNCYLLNEIDLPDNIVLIDNYAFANNTSLTKLKLPARLTKIGNNAFQNCSTLVQKLIIPANVTEIGTSAYENCTGITGIELPANLNTIGDYAFRNDSAIMEIVNTNPVPAVINASVFNGVDTNACTLTVLDNAVNAYSLADVWKSFKTINNGGVMAYVFNEDYKWGSVNTSTKVEGLFPVNEIFTASAEPKSGFEFTGWTSNGEVVSTENPITVKVVKDTSLTAHFVPIPKLVLLFEDFEGDNTVFEFANGTQANKWFVGTATAALNGSKSAYISNDEGLSNAYTNTSTSVTHIYSSLSLPPSTIPYLVEFEWKAQGESSYDYLDATFTTSTPAAGVVISQNLGRYNMGGDIWHNATTSYAGLASAANRNLVFMWRNDGSSGTQPPAAIDNIIVWKPLRVLASVDSSAQGTVSGNNITYRYMDTASVSASAKPGFSFAGWRLGASGSGSAAGEIISTLNPYKFLVDNDSISLVATFIKSGIDATLKSLTVSEGNLSPAFNFADTAYTVTVGSSVNSITIKAIPTSDSAYISGDYDTTAALNQGVNLFTVIVYSQDSSVVKTYTVSVIRQSADATLSSLTTSVGTLSPSFNAQTMAYSVNVENSVTSITLNATSSDAGATIDGIGVKPLEVGLNIFSILVTAEDAAITKTYLLVANRLEESVNLRDTVYIHDTVYIIVHDTIYVPILSMSPLQPGGAAFSIYPNPVSTGDLTVLSGGGDGFGGFGDGEKIEIYNLSGVCVATFQTKGERTAINVANLPKGTYILRIGKNALRFVKI